MLMLSSVACHSRVDMSEPLREGRTVVVTRELCNEEEHLHFSEIVVVMLQQVFATQRST